MNGLLGQVPVSSLPRERLVDQGAQALSNQELVAILLRTGQHPYHVMEIAGEVLKKFPTLTLLRQASLSELEKIRGIGKVKAIEISALMELGLRMHQEQIPTGKSVRTSFDIAHHLIAKMKDFHQEHLICIYLDTKNKILAEKTIFIGSLNQSLAHPREIFHFAVRLSAARLILSHNHRETRS